MEIGTVIATGKGIFAGPLASQVPDIRTSEDIGRISEAARKIGISIVYLEAFRDGVLESAEKLRWIKEELLKEGFEVRGCAALGIASGEFGQPAVLRDGVPGEFEPASWDCWSHPETLEGYGKISKRLAEVFDHILLDDCLCTSCFCARCIESFKKESGHDISIDFFRYALSRVSGLPERARIILRDFSICRMRQWENVVRQAIIEPARSMNPDIRIDAKLPQWHELYNINGYSLKGMCNLFDRVYVGTEIRDHLLHFPYYGYTHAQLVKNFCDYKEGGYAWFDTYSFSGKSWADPISSRALIEQARMSVLGGCQEMDIVFLGDLMHPSRASQMAELAAELPTLRKINDLTRYKEAHGVKVIVTEPSVGGLTHALDGGGTIHSLPEDDLYIESVLGMLGLPLVPETRPEKCNARDSLLLTEREVSKGPDMTWDIRGFVREGGTVILTARASDAIMRGCLGEEAILWFSRNTDNAYLVPQYSDEIEAFEFQDGRTTRCEIPVSGGPVIAEPQPDLQVFLWGTSHGKKIPLVFERSIGKGHLFAWNITFPYKQFFFSYPKAVHYLLRKLGGGLVGIGLDTLEDSVCLFLYGEDLVILENCNGYPVEVGLTFYYPRWPYQVTACEDVVTGERLSIEGHLNDGICRVSLQEHELKALRCL